MKRRIETLRMQIALCITSHRIEVKRMLHHTLLPLLITLIVFPACMSCSSDDSLNFRSANDALRFYQAYLGNLKEMKTSNTSTFYKEANKWRETSDTVFHYLMKIFRRTHHQGTDISLP